MLGDAKNGPGRRDFAAGVVLASKYRLLRCVGRGGMGQVWRAQDLVLGAHVAVKLIDPELLAVDESRMEVVGRFLREAQSAAALRSPHVVQIIEYGVDGQVPYIAMEFLEGETLDVRLARSRVLPYADTARILTHVGRAMARAHELGIVHRDLKPGNVFLTRNDDEELAKVMDFGIAKRTAGAMADGGAGMTRTGRIVGTPAYMSPEQMLATRPIDGQSDLWAIAVMAFECVCGRRPFEGATQGELTLQICAAPPPVPSRLARVPPGFDAWFERATQREPERRFAGAKELVEGLRAVLLQPNLPPPIAAASAYAGAPVDTQQGLVTARNLPAKPRRTGRVLLGVALGSLAGAAILAALIVHDRRTSAEATSAATSAHAAASSVEPSAPSAAPAAPAVPASTATGPAPPDAAAPTPSTTSTTAPGPSATAPEATAPTAAPTAHKVPRAPSPPKSRDPRLGF